MLKACLSSLVQQITEGKFTFDILVIDNNAEPQVKAGIAEIPAGVRLHIVHEPQRGIPFARNAALTFLNEHTHDYMAFIDDDEKAEPDWLLNHLDTLTKFGADATGGPVSFSYEGDVPSWYPREPVDGRPEGTPTGGGATNNIVFSRKVSSPDGFNLKFDTRFIIGGEDVEFFRRLFLAGGHIVWSPNAKVCETVPKERLTMDYVLHRQRNLATQYVQMLSKRKGSLRATLRFLLRIIRSIPMAAGWYCLWALRRLTSETKASELQFRYRLLLCQASGYWRGITNPDFNAPRAIQGY